MWRRVDLVRTNSSEERLASIFRIKKSACEKSVGIWTRIVSTLKMEATLSSGTPVYTRSIQRHISGRHSAMIKSMRMKMARHVARIRENVNTYRILVEKPERKKLL
jgi:hypothetical protein